MNGQGLNWKGGGNALAGQHRTEIGMNPQLGKGHFGGV